MFTETPKRFHFLDSEKITICTPFFTLFSELDREKHSIEKVGPDPCRLRKPYHCPLDITVIPVFLQQIGSNMYSHLTALMQPRVNSISNSLSHFTRPFRACTSLAWASKDTHHCAGAILGHGEWFTMPSSVVATSQV